MTLPAYDSCISNRWTPMPHGFQRGGINDIRNLGNVPRDPGDSRFGCKRSQSAVASRIKLLDQIVTLRSA
jgi:hypothetical protein